MPKLHLTSGVLTRMLFHKVVEEMRQSGVMMTDHKLHGYKFFVSAKRLNTLQVIFLDLRIPEIVTEFLLQFGAQIRNEFKNVNAHPHTTVLTEREYSKLSKVEK